MAAIEPTPANIDWNKVAKNIAVSQVKEFRQVLIFLKKYGSQLVKGDKPLNWRNINLSKPFFRTNIPSDVMFEYFTTGLRQLGYETVSPTVMLFQADPVNVPAVNHYLKTVDDALSILQTKKLDERSLESAGVILENRHQAVICETCHTRPIRMICEDCFWKGPPRLSIQDKIERNKKEKEFLEFQLGVIIQEKGVSLNKYPIFLERLNDVERELKELIKTENGERRVDDPGVVPCQPTKTQIVGPQCPACHTHQQTERPLFCENCNNIFGQEPATPADPTPINNPNDPLPIRPAPRHPENKPSPWPPQASLTNGQWQCVHCTYINHSGDTVCEVCAKSKSGVSAPEPKDRTLEQEPAMSAVDSPVEQTAMTKLSDPLPNASCAHNPVNKPSLLPPSATLANDQWRCSQCTLINSSEIEVCVACAYSKNDDFEHELAQKQDHVTKKLQKLQCMSGSGETTQKLYAEAVVINGADTDVQSGIETVKKQIDEIKNITSKAHVKVSLPEALACLVAAKCDIKQAANDCLVCRTDKVTTFREYFKNISEEDIHKLLSKHEGNLEVALQQHSMSFMYNTNNTTSAKNEKNKNKGNTTNAKSLHEVTVDKYRVCEEDYKAAVRVILLFMFRLQKGEVEVIFDLMPDSDSNVIALQTLVDAARHCGFDLEAARRFISQD